MGEIYIRHEYWFAAFQLIFAMLGMGATLKTDDFKQVLKAPKAVSLGTLTQLMIVPLIAYLFITALGISGGVAIGLALIAAIPGGTTSNIFTYFANGNIPLSISITAVTTLACLISTPIVLNLLIAQTLPLGFSMPTTQIVREIVLTLLLPLALGMGLLKAFPKQAPTISRWSIRLSLLGILAIIVGSSSAGRLDINAFGASNISLVLLFIVILGLLAWIVMQLFGLTRADRTAIEMEVLVRNINLAVLIKASLFPASLKQTDPTGDMVLFTILLYGAVQMLIAAVLILLRRRSSVAEID